MALVAITTRLKAKGVALHNLAMQLDTTTPTGKLMLQLMGCFAEFERDVMLERQREGIAKATDLEADLPEPLAVYCFWLARFSRRPRSAKR
jgi:DNA invertase Pin-like site-specific DNA recombinase